MLETNGRISGAKVTESTIGGVPVEEFASFMSNMRSFGRVKPIIDYFKFVGVSGAPAIEVWEALNTRDRLECFWPNHHSDNPDRINSLDQVTDYIMRTGKDKDGNEKHNGRSTLRPMLQGIDGKIAGKRMYRLKKKWLIYFDCSIRGHEDDAGWVDLVNDKWSESCSWTLEKIYLFGQKCCNEFKICDEAYLDIVEVLRKHKYVKEFTEEEGE